MNWRVNDLLYERKKIDGKPDTLEWLGRVAELRRNKHGAATKAVIRWSAKHKGKVITFDYDKHVVLLSYEAVREQLPEKMRTFLGANLMLVAIRAPLGSRDAVQFWSNKHGGVVHQVIRSEEAGELQFNIKFPDSGLYVHPEGTGAGDSFFVVEGESDWQQVDLDLEDEDVEVVY